MTEPICGERLASCTCGEPPLHEGPHVCNEPEVCVGSWKWSTVEDFEVISWPLSGKAVADSLFRQAFGHSP